MHLIMEFKSRKQNTEPPPQRETINVPHITLNCQLYLLVLSNIAYELCISFSFFNFIIFYKTAHIDHLARFKYNDNRRYNECLFPYTTTRLLPRINIQ